jgi:hypothetical protein
VGANKPEKGLTAEKRTQREAGEMQLGWKERRQIRSRRPARFSPNDS